VQGRKYRVTAYTRGYAGNNANATGGIFVRYLDATGASLGFVSLTGTTSSVRGANTAWFQLFGTFTVPATAVYIRIGLEQSSAGAGGDFIAFDDVELYPVDYDVNHAAGDVLINSTGLTVTNGAVTVTNAGSTVIIDGTSNMFKITATGTSTRAFPAAGTGATTSVTVSGSGASVLQTLFSTGIDNSSTANLRALGQANGVVLTDGHIAFRSYSFVDINAGDNRVRLTAESTISDPGTTAMHRYYLLKEAAI
jgi:hypothetical protein